MSAADITAAWAAYNAAPSRETCFHLCDAYVEDYGPQGVAIVKAALHRQADNSGFGGRVPQPPRLWSKGECLARYAEREPKGFAQFDGWFMPGQRDDVINPDAEGYAITGTGTTELMHGATVRVLISAGTDAQVAKALLMRIVDWIQRSPEVLIEETPIPQSVNADDEELPF
jgi:hypothetical protein